MQWFISTLWLLLLKCTKKYATVLCGAWRQGFSICYRVSVSRAISIIVCCHVSLCFSINFWIFSILPLPAPTHTQTRTADIHAQRRVCLNAVIVWQSVTLSHTHTRTHTDSYIRSHSCTNASVKVASYLFFSRLSFWIKKFEFAFPHGRIAISIFTWLIGFIFNLNHTKGKLITAWHIPASLAPPALS